MIKTPLNKKQTRPVLKVVHSEFQNGASQQNCVQHNSTPRTDVRTRGVVDKAIELEAMFGPAVAAGLLQTQHVPYTVAERVLLHPEQRRKA
jgi:hypothetical protein